MWPIQPSWSQALLVVSNLHLHLHSLDGSPGKWLRLTWWRAPGYPTFAPWTQLYNDHVYKKHASKRLRLLVRMLSHAFDWESFKQHNSLSVANTVSSEMFSNLGDLIVDSVLVECVDSDAIGKNHCPGAGQALSEQFLNCFKLLIRILPNVGSRIRQNGFLTSEKMRIIWKLPKLTNIFQSPHVIAWDRFAVSPFLRLPLFGSTTTFDLRSAFRWIFRGFVTTKEFSCRRPFMPF